MYNCLYETVLILTVLIICSNIIIGITNNILFTKIIETCWSGDIIYIWVLAQLELKIYMFFKTYEVLMY